MRAPDTLPAAPGTRRRRALWLLLVPCAVAASALAWWIVVRRPQPPPPDPTWTGRAVTLAGRGVDGFRDGAGGSALFSDPFGIAAAPDGTLYVADAGASQRIRRLTADGTVSTVAGGERGFADGSGSSARFDTPSGLTIGPDGALYVADTANHAIRRVTPDGQVSTIAGDGSPGFRDGPAHQARFNGPLAVALDPSGRILVADTYNDRIRAIAPDGVVTTIAGGDRPGAADGPSGDATFDTPSGIAVDGTGRILVADTGNSLVRIIDRDGKVTTALPLSEGLLRPLGIAAGSAGDVYVSDDRGRVAAASAEGTIWTVAGGGTGFRDGLGAEVRFRRPAGLAVVGPRRLVVADAGNFLVRKVATPSDLPIRPPASPRIAPSFDDEGFARVPLLWPVWPMEGPHEVAGTLGETRGSDGSERFHAGIDIRAAFGTPVRAVRDGVVAAPLSTGGFGSLNEWLRIGPLVYVHIRAGRTRQHVVLDDRFVPTCDEHGRLERIRVRRGARFHAGEVIATVNPFNHVHLNVGWPGEEHNPLRFRLTGFQDTIRPTIARGGVRLFDRAGAPITRREDGRYVVSGQVRVVVDAWDQADGNRPGRRLGLYSLGYQILRRNGEPAAGFETPLETIRFDRLAADPAAASLVFAPGSGIPFYGRRVTRFLYTVTNTFLDGAAAESFWDTTLHEPGDYILRIFAKDFQGNVAVENRDVPVRVYQVEISVNSQLPTPDSQGGIVGAAGWKSRPTGRSRRFPPS